MRWLICHPAAHFSVHDVFVGWREAIEATGEKVVTFPLGDALSFYSEVLFQAGPGEFRRALTNEQAIGLATDRLAGALYKVRPSILLLVSGFFLPHELLDAARRDGVRVVLLCTEEPYERDRELALAEHCDVVLLNDPTHLDAFQRVSAAWYQPHSYRPSVHMPGPVDVSLAADLAFVGTGYPSRVEFFEQMDLDGLDVLLAGNWQALDEDSPLRKYAAHGVDECLPNEQVVDIYRSIAVGMNLYRREAERPELSEGWSIGPREVELAAVGAFFLREPRGEGDALFGSLPRFTSPSEASDLVRWWLDRPEGRAEAAGKARAAIQDRTFDNAAARLLRHLEKEKGLV